MVRRFLAVLGVTALAFTLAAQAQDKKADPKSDPKAVSDESALTQDELYRRFADFKAALLRVAQRLESTGKAEDRDKAKQLREALDKASAQGTEAKFLTLIAELKKTDTFNDVRALKDVMDKNRDLQKDLRLLIEMLIRDDRDKQLKEERERLERLLEQLKELIGKQERVRAQTEIGRMDKKNLGEEQNKVTQATAKLANTNKNGEAKHEKSEAKYGDKGSRDRSEGKADTKDNKGDNRNEGKPNIEAKPGDKPNTETKPGDKGENNKPSEAKNDGGKNDNKPSEGKGGDNNKPSEGKPSPNANKPESKAGDNKNNDKGGKPSDAKPGDNKGGKPSEAKGGDGSPMKPGEGKPSDNKGGEGKPGDGKPGEGKGGEGKPGDNKGGKPSDGKGGDGAGKPGDSKENKPSDGKGGDSKGGPSAGGDKKPGEPKEGGLSKTNPASGKPPEAGKPEQVKPGEKKPGEPKGGNGPANGKMNQKPNAKPSEAKGNAGKPGQPKSGTDTKGASEGKGDSKPSSSPSPSSPMNPMKPNGSSPSGQPKSGNPSGQQGQPKSGGQPPPAGQQNPDDNPVKKQIEDSNKYQKEAEKKIDKENNDGASKDQDEAIKKLEQAKKTLEQLLKQLREEEMERLLAKLQERCEYMLRLQIQVRDGTKSVAKDLGGKKFTELNEEIRDQLYKATNKHLDTEVEIVGEAQKAVRMIEAEGTAIAFAEIFRGTLSDMKNIATRLKQPDVGEVTVAIENDVIETLKDMIEALKKAREENKNKGQPKPPGPKGPPADPKLLDMITELKLILSRQMRVNERTQLYGKQYKGEQAVKPSDLPKDPKERERIENLQREHEELGTQQDNLRKITNDIYKGKNKAQGE
jgi:hypothetical protein